MAFLWLANVKYSEVNGEVGIFSALFKTPKAMHTFKRTRELGVLGNLFQFEIATKICGSSWRYKRC